MLRQSNDILAGVGFPDQNGDPSTWGVAMSSRSESALVTLRRIMHVADTNARALARRTGLTLAQMIVLEIVAEDDRSTPKEIARRSGVSQATITSLIDKLEGRGFVTRRRSVQDRRLIRVTATEEGRRLLANAPNPLYAAFSSKFEALPDWEQLMLLAGLERVAGLMNADTVEALPPTDEVRPAAM
ncbi:MAG: MarR family winged helix-turn-helix transcriptional regulator [Rhodobacterales bacterium]